MSQRHEDVPALIHQTTLHVEDSLAGRAGLSSLRSTHWGLEGKVEWLMGMAML